MKKVLAIDGGGIRGIIPGQVLVALEHKLQIKAGNPNARIADYFDFIAGTSTGGILACIYLCPSLEDPIQARFSAQDAVDIYIKNGHKIFDINLLKRIQSVNGILDEKYDSAPLEGILKSYFQDLKLSQLLKPCLIPAYDIDRRAAHFFAQHDYGIKGVGKDFLVRDVCRATSAAPTYFETALIQSCSGVSYPLVDGGVFANNPSLCAYSEIRNAIDNPTAEDMFIVSLGTGSQYTRYQHKTAKNWGAVGWIKPIIDVMMAGASDTTDYHLMKIFSAAKRAQNYIRLQPTYLRDASLQLDDASPSNLKALVEVGIETAQNCAKELDRIVEVLVEGPDQVTYQTVALGDR